MPKTDMKLRERITEFLMAHADQKFTVRQIAEWFQKTFPDECRQKMENSKRKKLKPIETEKDLQEQLVAEISRQREAMQRAEPRIQTIEERPRKFYFSEQTNEEESQRETITISDASNDGQTEGRQRQEFSEHDLYPLLSEYLATEFSLHSKRIDEKTARNTRGARGNHWLFPDLVGLETLSNEWKPITKECAKEFGGKRARLWSFEVKLVLNQSNVREAFFQTASNSAWANFGYLVAGEINGKNTMQELQMLADLHSIGVIRLDREDPTQKSELLIPAREKTEVDWTSVNRLAEENSDFQYFIRRATNFQQIDPVQWDASPLDNED